MDSTFRHSNPPDYCCTFSGLTFAVMESDSKKGGKMDTSFPVQEIQVMIIGDGVTLEWRILDPRVKEPDKG